MIEGNGYREGERVKRIGEKRGRERATKCENKVTLYHTISCCRLQTLQAATLQHGNKTGLKNNDLQTGHVNSGGGGSDPGIALKIGIDYDKG